MSDDFGIQFRAFGREQQITRIGRFERVWTSESKCEQLIKAAWSGDSRNLKKGAGSVCQHGIKRGFTKIQLALKDLKRGLNPWFCKRGKSWRMSSIF